MHASAAHGYKPRHGHYSNSVGYLQNINGSYGGNLFESPYVFPLNFTLAALSIFTPDVVGFLKNKFVNTYHRVRRKKS